MVKPTSTVDIVCSQMLNEPVANLENDHVDSVTSQIGGLLSVLRQIPVKLPQI